MSRTSLVRRWPTSVDSRSSTAVLPGSQEFLVEVLQHPQVAPQALAPDQAGHVREDVVRPVPQQVLAIALELRLGLQLVGQADLVGRDAVVHDVDVGVLELRGQEPQLVDHVVADGEDLVAVLGGLDQGVFEVGALVAEDVVDVHAGGRGRIS